MYEKKIVYYNDLLNENNNDSTIKLIKYKLAKYKYKVNYNYNQTGGKCRISKLINLHYQ